MKYSFAAVLLFISFFSCGNHFGGMDKVNAYEFKFEDTELFNDYNKFINEMGLPQTFTTFKDTVEINSREDLDAALAKAMENGEHMMNLCYPGIKMDFISEDLIVPEIIDFRKTDKSIRFKNITFDKSFSVDDFKKLFPVAGSMSLDDSFSLFKMITKENLPKSKHYMVMRESKDVPPGSEDGPVIEFTFDNDKLIYMFFANF